MFVLFIAMLSLILLPCNRSVALQFFQITYDCCHLDFEKPHKNYRRFVNQCSFGCLAAFCSDCFFVLTDLSSISHNESKPIPLLFTHFQINVTFSMFGQCSSLFYWTIHCIFWCVFFPTLMCLKTGCTDHSNDGRDTCQSSIIPKKQNIMNTFTFQGCDWALSTP